MPAIDDIAASLNLNAMERERIRGKRCAAAQAQGWPAAQTVRAVMIALARLCWALAAKFNHYGNSLFLRTLRYRPRKSR